MKNNKMFLRISPIIFSPFIINRISSLDELLSFGEISFDTVEPLADRFLITYQRWSQMMSDKEEIEKKKKRVFFRLYKEIHQRDGDENLFILFGRYREKTIVDPTCRWSVDEVVGRQLTSQFDRMAISRRGEFHSPFLHRRAAPEQKRKTK